jgi:2-C-methyl-D-erythritol 2,4-cyclodiphosphate synthase
MSKAGAFRIGQGIDVHRFAAGRPLVLGGVTIPSDRGLEGHSDADVILHALMDALLGAAGKPDIGAKFPNTDAKWKGARSLDLLAAVHEEIARDGWAVVNADIAVLAEAPKLAPFIPDMKKLIAAALKIDYGAIGIKATTNEGLGYVGRGEGIFASAVVLLARE